MFYFVYLEHISSPASTASWLHSVTNIASYVPVPLLNKAALTIDEKSTEGMSKVTEGVSVSFDAWIDISHKTLMAINVTTGAHPGCADC